MIDWKQLDELRSDMGDSFDEIVEVFLEEVEAGVGKLRDAPQDARAAPLHFLKGAALNLGFAKFAELCADGETRANAGKGASVEIDAVIDCYRQSRSEFIAGLDARAA